MMEDWRTKVFDPVATRIAEKILANQMKLAEVLWMALSLVLWNSLITLTLVYRYIIGLKCRRENIQLLYRCCVNGYIMGLELRV